jgi:hypothetical protein
MPSGGGAAPGAVAHEEGAAKAADPTTLKPQETNPFSGE